MRKLSRVWQHVLRGELEKDFKVIMWSILQQNYFAENRSRILGMKICSMVWFYFNLKGIFSLKICYQNLKFTERVLLWCSHIHSAIFISNLSPSLTPSALPMSHSDFLSAPHSCFPVAPLLSFPWLFRPLLPFLWFSHQVSWLPYTHPHTCKQTHW